MLINLNHQLISCEQEPLAFSGHVQSHGVLLFLNRGRGKFSHVSVNCKALLGEDANTLFKQNAFKWLEETLAMSLELPAVVGKRVYLPNALNLPSGAFHLLISACQDGWLFEFEMSSQAIDLADLPSIEMTDRNLSESDIEQLQASVTKQIQAMTGFYRVMLYRFHADWSGEVIAESVTKSDRGSYLGLRFPASDIPAIARALYTKTPYRHIPNAEGNVVPIVSNQALEPMPSLDLTWSDLRSVSPVHIQYLKNMRVFASFSISVMVYGKLWGLMACHHDEPRLIPMTTRQQCAELVSRYALVQKNFDIRFRNRLYDATLQCTDALKLPSHSFKHIEQAFQAHADKLLNLFNACAGVLLISQRQIIIGQAINPDFILALHKYIQSTQSETIFAIDHLPEGMKPCCHCYLSLNQSVTRDICGVLGIQQRSRFLELGTIYFYWLRREEVQEIAWAGNPNKPIEESPEGLKFSPRHSFEKWVEMRRDYSAPWLPETLFIAEQWCLQMEKWL